MDDFDGIKITRRDLLILGAVSATAVTVPSVAGTPDFFFG